MISYRSGNLLNSPDLVIVHGVNNRGVMNAGVAKDIRATWPKVYKDYIDIWNQRVYYDTIQEMLGTNIITETPDRIIVSCVTQSTYGFKGKHVSYDAVDTCMKYLVPFLMAGQYTSLSMPKIGAGLGGGCWEVIAAIINDRLKDFQVTVWEL